MCQGPAGILFYFSWQFALADRSWPNFILLHINYYIKIETRIKNRRVFLFFFFEGETCRITKWYEQIRTFRYIFELEMILLLSEL